MSIYNIDFSKMWKDGRYFAQIPLRGVFKTRTASDGTLVGDVLAVATDLLGGAYVLNNVTMPPEKDLEVYDALTQILPPLSEQSVFHWKTLARTLASMLATAKYPIRAQASHLIFWWARLGGLMGATSLETRIGEHHDSCTTDGSNIEYSLAIPVNTNPSEGSNRRVRFAIDPHHPDGRHRIAGGAVLDYLWSAEGGMGLVKNDPGSKKWKDTLEKWLFPDIKNTEEFVEGTIYQIAFDMEPSGEITLKMYYTPPSPVQGKTHRTRISSYTSTDDLEPFKRLVKDLHPSLEKPFNMFVDYIHGDGKEARMKWVIVACDVTTSEKNRLKVYLVSERKTLKDMIQDMTLGGRVTGPRIEAAVENFSKFYKHLHTPQTKPEEAVKTGEVPRITRKDVQILLYYEFFVGEPAPYCKIYFMMDHFSKNDYETAKATEAFFQDVGKPGDEGWMVKALAHANPHRPLNKRNGIHTAASFGTKPAGWDVTNYYSPEMFAPERVAQY